MTQFEFREVELKCGGGKAGKTYQFYAKLYLEMSAAQFAKENFAILPDRGG